MHGRLFFGFEYHCYAVYVIALDPTGRPVLRVTFPLHDRGAANLETGPAADVAASSDADSFSMILARQSSRSGWAWRSGQRALVGQA